MTDATLPFISIVGPTASGKTELAIELSKQLVKTKIAETVAVISADSKQVYQGLEILTGADIPANFIKSSSPVGGSSDFSFYSYKADNKITLHAISIIKITNQWSLAHFRQLVDTVIKNNTVKNRLIILVGGTGLYHAHAFSTDRVIDIPPNPEVRYQASKMSLSELQSWVEKVNKNAFAQLNQSDRNNPRRLIRLIEKSLTKLNLSPEKTPDIPHLYFGLKVQKDELFEKIIKRVETRLAGGAIAEVGSTIDTLIESGDPASISKVIGFQEIQAYLNGDISRKECVEHWAKRELSYSKRQMTWFKKNREIKWFEVQSLSDLVSRVMACYTEKI